MSVKEIMSYRCKCERCGYEWTADSDKWGSDKLPKYCAKCNSPYWNIPRGTTKIGRPPRLYLLNTSGKPIPPMEGPEWEATIKELGY